MCSIYIRTGQNIGSHSVSQAQVFGVRPPSCLPALSQSLLLRGHARIVLLQVRPPAPQKAPAYYGFPTPSLTLHIVLTILILHTMITCLERGLCEYAEGYNLVVMCMMWWRDLLALFTEVWALVTIAYLLAALGLSSTRYSARDLKRDASQGGSVCPRAFMIS